MCRTLAMALSAFGTFKTALDLTQEVLANMDDQLHPLNSLLLSFAKKGGSCHGID